MTREEKIGALVITVSVSYFLLLPDRRGFAERAGPDAGAVGREYGLPLWLILTQAAHESNYGKSGLTARGNNLFGFTAQKGYRGPVIEMQTTEYKDGKPYGTRRAFRRYGSWRESMRDYARLLTTQPRYRAAVEQARLGRVKEAFAALNAAGYATDPKYGPKLARVFAGLKIPVA